MYNGPKEYTNGLEDFRFGGTANKKNNKEDGVPGALGIRCSCNTMVCIYTFLANANGLIALNSFRSESDRLFEVPVRIPPSFLPI